MSCEVKGQHLFRALVGAALVALWLTGCNEVKETTLANGLKVIVKRDHRAPVVVSQIWYKVGSADDPKGKSGNAHFLEHLMFKGTETLAPGEFSKIVAANCPFCIQMFEDGIPAVQPDEANRIAAFDVAELLERSVFGEPVAGAASAAAEAGETGED